MTYETLVVETNSAGVAVLTLNRPGKLNALTDLMFTELSNRLVPARDLIPAATAIAEQIAANSPFGVALTKEILQTNVDAPSLAAAIELENRSQTLATRTADMTEALAAFREKRVPAFTRGLMMPCDRAGCGDPRQ